MSRDEAKLAKFNAKREKADQKSLARAQVHQERLGDIEARQAELEKIGREIAHEKIQSGARLIDIGIYENGFVKIGRGYEKLLGISGDTQVLRKTAIGRSAATVASAVLTPFPGFNLLSPGQRGRISLVVITDKTTHTFSTEQVHEFTVRSYESLLAAGKTVLEMNQTAPTADKPQPAAVLDLAGQLKQISELHAEGVLSDAEFSAAKAKLLGNS